MVNSSQHKVKGIGFYQLIGCRRMPVHSISPYAKSHAVAESHFCFGYIKDGLKDSVYISRLAKFVTICMIGNGDSHHTQALGPFRMYITE